MLNESHQSDNDSCQDPDCGHNHENDDDLEQKIEEMRADFAEHFKADEETLRLVTDLARGKNKWKDLLVNRILMLDEIVEWNNESLEPLVELYGAYLNEGSDETMTQFSVLESRRLLMRDFFIIKTLQAKIGSDISNIDKRLGRIEKSLKSRNSKK